MGTKKPGSNLCIPCYKAREMGAAGNRTLGEMRAALTTLAFHATVRGHARRAYAGPMTCLACGYNLHVDICHIKPVSAFPEDATLFEVNAADNLVALDKRCHWEFDHGYLRIENGAVSQVIPRTRGKSK